MRKRLARWLLYLLLIAHPVSATTALGLGYAAGGEAATLAAVNPSADDSGAALVDPSAPETAPCHEAPDGTPCNDCAACHLAASPVGTQPEKSRSPRNGRLPVLAAASPESFVPDPPRRPPLG